MRDRVRDTPPDDGMTSILYGWLEVLDRQPRHDIACDQSTDPADLT